jgi:CRISPR/Cas system CSM-associated protein Csm3 (group 7 of RAMP superfamily)
VLRSAVERIINATGDATGLGSCTLFTKADRNQKGDCNQQALDFQRERERTGDAPNDPASKEAALAEWAREHLCDVCRLFGCTVYASRLVIEDAYPADKSTYKNLVRDGVGIDRDTGTACEGAKFDYEVLEPGPKFRLRMQAENVTCKDAVLIKLVLCLLRDGLFVGGKQSAGLGRMKLEGRLTATGFLSPEALWKAIQAGDDPHQTIPWEEPAC